MAGNKVVMANNSPISGQKRNNIFRCFCEDVTVSAATKIVDDTGNNSESPPLADDYLECLTTIERQDLTKRIMNRISNELEHVLQPENCE